MKTTLASLISLLLPVSATLAGCGSEEGPEDVAAQQTADLNVGDLGIATPTVTRYRWNDGLGRSVRMLPVSDGFCMLQSAQGRFQGAHAGARIDQLLSGGRQYYFLGGSSDVPGVSTSAVCLRYAGMTGAGLGTAKTASWYLTSAPSAPTSLDLWGSDAACTLRGFGGNMIDGEVIQGNRLRSSFVGAVVDWDRASQAFWTRSSTNNDEGGWAMAQCLAFTGRGPVPGLHQSQYHLDTRDSNWAKLAPNSGWVCGLSGVVGQLANAGDKVEITEGADGTQRLEARGGAPDYIGPEYVTALCIGIAQ